MSARTHHEHHLLLLDPSASSICPGQALAPGVASSPRLVSQRASRSRWGEFIPVVGWHSVRPLPGTEGFEFRAPRAVGSGRGSLVTGGGDRRLGGCGIRPFEAAAAVGPEDFEMGPCGWGGCAATRWLGLRYFLRPPR